jgi:diguanylate cyclase (GGDEF)-like protein/PAS domain S-box-containing protein
MGVISASAELAEALIRSAETGIYIVQDGKLAYCNTLFVKCTGFNEDELVGKCPLDHVYPDDREFVRQRAIENLKGINNLSYEYRFVKRNGELMWVMERVTSTCYGGRRASVGSFMDITSRKQAEVELRLKSDLLDAATDAITLRDFSGNIYYANEVAYKSLGYSREEYMNMNISHILTEECSKTVGLNEAMLREKGYATYISEVYCKDRTVMPVEIYARVIHSENMEFVLSIGRDITERRRVEKQLTHIATHDALTGLPNRVLFYDRLTTALEDTARTGKRLAVMMLDLDGFKTINDSLGHSDGDRLLMLVSERLRTILRKSDTIARMGGDEFMVLLPHLNVTDHVEIVAQKLLDAFNRPYMLNERRVHITTSIGIAVYPDDGDGADMLIQNADKSMYIAKEQGKNGYRRFDKIDHNISVMV